jgi:segregation and condensation protein B
MDETEIKYVVEAALLAAGRPLTLERIAELFTGKGPGVDRATLKRVLDALAADYRGRGIEVGEVSSGYRIQVKRSMSDWLRPLWEEKAPRYTRALLETLALVAYRQPITRGEIEEVRGVVVSTNIMRTLLERGWVRVVGHRDVPGKPAMFGTTREFLDYFGLRKLEDLPPLAELKDGVPELSPQTDLIDSLEAEARGELPPAFMEGSGPSLIAASAVAATLHAGDDGEEPFGADDADTDDSAESPRDELVADVDEASGDDDLAARPGRDEPGDARDDSDVIETESADVIPLRAAPDRGEPAE